LAAASARIGIWVEARGPSEMPAALGALEHGAKCVLVPIRSARTLEALAASIGRPALARIRWTEARIRAVRPIGLSERVLVDTVSILSEDEGLLIGSTAQVLFHVLSESVGSRFSAARPFRVNAGAPHSYVLMADGSTRYLSELAAGDQVLAVRADGSSRTVRIGRIKIERRPMLLVAATLGDAGATLFAQEAETVCLAAGSRRVAVTELRTGQRVRSARLPPGRHLGRIVDESIEER
ncbi:MAG TPA: 3-dehydroquinate synthase II, partial [Thermoplasmata archaeon]|nr:3-dehydroquinate synthase II [Thermoplasmata archaeon]